MCWFDTAVSPIPEVSPSKEQQDIADMCQQLTQGLSALATDESFTGAPNGTPMNNVRPPSNVQGMYYCVLCCPLTKI